ncbi:ABC transporter ATP-binding protein [Bacteriovorax stolpii]|uniref:Multidrug ABC transporter ATP-binding protein n=1 Tax=Bacteriovorax stolpii TaxID=960 RepID=A0A2K9NMA2_BACTC|nr:ABC transporter ATP-binding protein [Bacteriovorax stolpii]AUN96641.1 multidrug ABC transporter ATP-binding protein [Bacteriovorax stolpii]QDK43427.1 ABC transporter ATP-binding protein [Bacteriovorax stolpii]TDP53838.1 ABC-2 type transport system ATP-binding protein [Bacteriovorax stolpii]
MIEFVNITKKFQNHFWEKPFLAVDNVSFSISKGDLVGFLGANGAGKTTLIKILMDFSRPTSGIVKFDQSFGNESIQIRSKIGYLPERAYLYQHLTGREFLNYVGSLNDISRKELRNLIEKWAEKIQIQHALDRQVRGYSKGMQQRLGFISALIHNPSFLVLDEPLSGLDPVGRKEFKQILKELNEEGVTIFFSSHIVSDVEEICNKVVFIEKGKLIYTGGVDQLIHQNSKDGYSLKYYEDDQVKTLNFSEKEKFNVMKDLLKRDVNIIALDKEKMSLEEIIYRIKK